MSSITPEALQEYCHDHIPLSKAIGVSVEIGTPQVVRLLAPLAPNSNHHGTLFGGSASAVAVLSACGLLHVAMRYLNIEADPVVKKSSMIYEWPITDEFFVEAITPAAERWQRFIDMLMKHKRARINIKSILTCDGRQAGAFDGDFVASIF